ncbi:MAG: DUF3551 domain-containing protein [Pseudomonadota bacterium]
MRNALLAVLAVAGVSVLGAEPAAARDYRFCLVEGGFASGPGTCYYNTYAQCMASASGLRAYCQLNPVFAFAEQRREKRPHKVRRQHRQYD